MSQTFRVRSGGEIWKSMESVFRPLQHVCFLDEYSDQLAMKNAKFETFIFHT